MPYADRRFVALLLINDAYSVPLFVGQNWKIYAVGHMALFEFNGRAHIYEACLVAHQI
jgi:hypothetical protein